MKIRERAFDQLARVVSRSPWIVLGIASLVTVAAGAASGTLRMETRILDLVPRDGQLLTADVLIDVTCPDDTRFVRFQVSPDDGANWYNLEGTQSPNDYTEDSDASDGWSQIWSTATDALPDGVAYRIRVTAWDEQNPVAHLIGEDQVGGGLVVDNTPPSLEIAIAPRPTDGPLTGEVFQPEITLTGSFFDLPDSARVVGITIEHRNENGDYVSDSPIHIPATEFTFSRVLRMLEGRNYIVVTATDEAGLTSSESAEIHYLVPEEAYPIFGAVIVWGGIHSSVLPDQTVHCMNIHRPSRL